MGRILFCFIVLIVISGAQQAAEAQINKNCCMKNKAKCDAFCQTPEGIAQGGACRPACERFVASCLQTGIFPWRHVPSSCVH